MPHWLKNDPGFFAPTLFLFFFKGMEAINTRLYGSFSPPCKSSPGWQAALQYVCHERRGKRTVQSACPDRSFGAVA
jgi:hypothetical protein